MRSHDIRHEVSLSNLTSKNIKSDPTTMYRSQSAAQQIPTRAPSTSSHAPPSFPPPSPPPLPHLLQGSSAAAGDMASRGGGVFSAHKPQEETKVPALEKPTAVFTLAPPQSQSGGGFEPEYKHQTLLNNQTSLATERCEKTQEDVNYCKHWQGSPPLDNGTRTGDLEGLNEQISNIKPSQLSATEV